MQKASRGVGEQVLNSYMVHLTVLNPYKQISAGGRWNNKPQLNALKYVYYKNHNHPQTEGDINLFDR